ncbi:caspase family protein [Mesorhizobium sp. M1006]|uniref:caspase family protein n=1 Tax=Mesorhizobium sp. M1006 TaxID=2957048 RepID=UPI003339A59B
MAFAALLLCALVPASAEEPKALKGVALVIGQSDYEHVGKLPNPENDARAIEEMFDRLGFETDVAINRDARKLRRDLEGFVDDAEGADVAIIYYSGHGIEAGGVNFLVPVDADITALDDAGEKLVPLSSVVAELKAKVPVTIVLLDACRNDPFPPGTLLKLTPGEAGKPIGAGGLGSTRSVVALNGRAPAKGSADDSLGQVIGFAAEPGKVALDGPADGNSPYAAAILRHIDMMGGEEFGTVLRMIGEEVYLKTGGRQRPWVNESLRRLLYFGTPAEVPKGEEGEILSERRRLLVTISTLPDPQRRQIETIARDGGVPMDTLYAMLKTLGTEKPRDAAELDKLLRGQTERLKQVLAEQATLKSQDPEIVRLSRLAEQAVQEGALEAAQKIHDRPRPALANCRRPSTRPKPTSRRVVSSLPRFSATAPKPTKFPSAIRRQRRTMPRPMSRSRNGTTIKPGSTRQPRPRRSPRTVLSLATMPFWCRRSLPMK